MGFSNEEQRQGGGGWGLEELTCSPSPRRGLEASQGAPRTPMGS